MSDASRTKSWIPTAGAASHPAEAVRARAIESAARRALGMLAGLYLLGMAENLVGSPKEVSGTAAAVSGIVLLAHVVVAIGLVVGASRLAWVSRGDPGVARLASAALVVVVVTFVSGGLTAMEVAPADVWSYVMAAGFLVAAALYVALYVRVREAARAA